MATRAAIPFSVRRATTADAATVAALGARLFTESYGPTHPEPELSRYLARTFSEDVMREAIGSDDVTMLLAEDADGAAIGYSFMRDSPAPPEGVSGDRVIEIVRFYVDGAAQGRGVGAALMAQSIADAREQGADTLWLQAWKEAPWAVGFYQRMGFTVVGSTLFHFGEQQTGEDHVMAITIA
ncbi:MAG TPA: GNAT family N-acetyltransferase [Gemmatimonadaceae bacterium]